MIFQKACFIAAIDFGGSDIDQVVRKKQDVAFVGIEPQLFFNFYCRIYSLNSFADSLLEPFKFDGFYHVIDGIQVESVSCKFFVGGGKNDRLILNEKSQINSCGARHFNVKNA